MNGTRILAVVTMGLALLSASPGWAQDELENEGEGDWGEEIKPGIRIYSGSSDKSMLAEATKQGASIVISDEEQPGGEDVSFTPGGRQPEVSVHTVKQGDTLWDICEQRFGDPYMWPRVWAFNQSITNPHWIYPGDMLWLTSPEARIEPVPNAPPKETRTGEILARRGQSMLLRNRGFIDQETLEKSGELVGSQKETMMLAQNDEAYVEFSPSTPVQPGDEFAAYRVLKSVDGVDDPKEEAGKLVEILGAVRVTTFDEDHKIARVIVDESMKPMERGTLIGPIHRRFDYVEPAINNADIDGHILAMLDPIVLAASQHIVFVDRGKEHGVQDGNRFFVVQSRDGWRKSRNEKDDRQGYPTEVLAELRVVEARAKTSTCLVLNAVRELEVGEKVEMRKGF